MNSTKVKQSGNSKKPKSKAKSTAKNQPQVKKVTATKKKVTPVKRTEPIERWDWWNDPVLKKKKEDAAYIKALKDFDDKVEAIIERDNLLEAGQPVPFTEHELYKFLAHHQN